MIKNQKSALLVFLLLAFTYGYYAHDPGANGNSRLDLTFAIVQEGRLTIDSYHDQEGTQTIDKAFFNGHYYSDKAIGTSLLGVVFYTPMYWLMKLFSFELELRQIKYLLTFLVIGLPSAITGCLLYLLCEIISKSKMRAFVAALSIMLGTMCLPFSAIFFGHQLAAALLFSSFFLIFRLRLKPDLKNRPFYLFWIGFLLGCAFITEYTTLVIILPLAAYFIYRLWEKKSLPWKLRKLMMPTLGGLIPIVILMIYNQRIFGNPFTIGYEHLGNEFSTSMSQGLLGIHWPSIKVLFYLTFHPAQGLFWQSPVLLMGFVGIYYMLKDQQYYIEGIVITISSILYLLLNSGYFMWWGGASFGPRHLIPMLPFLAIPLVFLPRRLFPWVIIFGILSIAQMFIPLAGFIEVPDDIFTNIGKLGFFSYSTIYNYCLPQLLKGYFAYNLGEKIFGLKSWMILVPNLLAILIITAIVFLDEIIIFGRKYMRISK
jgi:hypothetical protein